MKENNEFWLRYKTCIANDANDTNIDYIKLHGQITEFVHHHDEVGAVIIKLWVISR